MSVDLSVVIPVYNEEGNIQPLYEELTDVLSSSGRSYEILFVDDRSTDATFQQLTELHRHDPAITIIRFRSNFGQSAAMKAGFDHACGDLIITMDADLQNDPNDIPKLLADLQNRDLDVVCGWRHNRNDPVSKKIFSKIANRIRKTLTHEEIHDSGCTLRVYRNECVRDMELYGELHRYIPAMLLWKGYRVGEVKANHRGRHSGKSKYSWLRLAKGFFDLIVITFWQRYSFRPMHIFGAAGLIMGFSGFFITIYLVTLRLFFDVPLFERPLFLIGLILLILGVQFFASGILADILLKIYYGQKNRKSYLIERIISHDQSE